MNLKGEAGERDVGVEGEEVRDGGMVAGGGGVVETRWLFRLSS